MQRRAMLRLLGLAPVTLFGRSVAAHSPTAGGHARTFSEPDVELALTASPGEARIVDGQPTRVWQFSAQLLRGPAATVQALPGSYLGPVLRFRRGQHVRVRFSNQLGEPSIVHWHGLDVPEVADGHPRLAVGHRSEYVYDFEVTNRAGTYWYHPHPHMRTAPQVYHGLAGLLLVSDEEEDALRLPSGDAELLCVLQDRRFDGNQQLVYASGAMGMGMGMGQMMETMNGWLGDRILVSGRLQPTVDVERKTYRVRLLNGSNARIYKLAWSDGSPMIIIGNDGGLLERPRSQQTLTLATGQRADVLLDLSGHGAGAEIRLQNIAFPPAAVGRVGMMGETSPLPQGAPFTLMTLRTTAVRGPRYGVPDRLSTHDFHPAAEAPTRRVPLSFQRMTWTIAGQQFDMHNVGRDEVVAAGSTYIWELINEINPMGMAMAHPVHLHGRQFRVLSRHGGSANALREGINDEGWIDTVLLLPGETVRVQVTFSRHPGLYLYHCHILEHEDMGMMRNFRIV
jgi:FtsP/CotA-like multicopper oxidase with cupredoxin domain